YPRFAAQGGDWGAFVTTCLGAFHADKVAGIHLTLLAAGRDGDAPGPTTPDDVQQYLDELKHWEREETGYQWIQGTRPQTLAYGPSAATTSAAGPSWSQAGVSRRARSRPRSPPTSRSSSARCAEARTWHGGCNLDSYAEYRRLRAPSRIGRARLDRRRLRRIR